MSTPSIVFESLKAKGFRVLAYILYVASHGYQLINLFKLLTAASIASKASILEGIWKGRKIAYNHTKTYLY